MSASHDLGVVATSGVIAEDGIRIWNLQSGKCDLVIFINQDGEIDVSHDISQRSPGKGAEGILISPDDAPSRDNKETPPLPTPSPNKSQDIGKNNENLCSSPPQHPPIAVERPISSSSSTSRNESPNVSSICFLTPLPLLLFSKENGEGFIWGISGVWKGMKISSFRNEVDLDEYAYQSIFTPDDDFDPQTTKLSQEEEEEKPKYIRMATKESMSLDQGNTNEEEVEGDEGIQSNSGTSSLPDNIPHIYQVLLDCKTSGLTDKMKAFGGEILVMKWDSEKNLLYTGDESGQLRCWSLQSLVDFIMMSSQSYEVFSLFPFSIHLVLLLDSLI